MTKVAVVTGSNKGIGFAIVRGLCKQFSGDVYLTARDVGRGEAAVAELNKEGLQPKFHQLDIEDVASIETLKSHLVQNYGGLDVLVNNAGMAFKCDATDPFAIQAEVSVRVNYFGTLNVLQSLMPILKAGARVVTLSSMCSTFAIRQCSAENKARVLSCHSVQDISQAMKDFVSATKAGNHKEQGWPSSAYGTSKMGLSMLTPVLQKQLSADSSRPDIVVNACCPGYVATDMSSYKGHKTIDEGADTPLYLALLPANTEHPKGEYVTERQIKDWTQ